MVSHPSTIGDVVRRSAARYPEKIALRFGDRSWSYPQLDDAVHRVASALLNAGLNKGDRVAAYGKNSDTYLILFLACARAGLVHVPVNFNVTADDLAYLIGQSSSRALVHDEALAGQVDAVADRVKTEFSFTSGWLLEHASATVPVPDLVADVHDDDLVQLLYTSGTTAAPKGAMMTHRALLHEYVSSIVALDFVPEHRVVHALPLYHSAQMHVFLLPYLMIGAENDIVAGADPGELLRRIEQDRVSSVFAPPTVWIGIVNHPDFTTRDLSSLRGAYYGASIMPVPVLERLRSVLTGAKFYNCFGQSEIGPLACVLRPEDHADRPSSAGRPVLFVEARVVDAEGADVAVGELGEVVYRSPQLLTGYWDKPEETAASFFGAWFRSGDLVRRDEQGYLFVVDRIKDVINTGGVLVASREVEDALYRHPGVAEVAVIGVPHERWIEAIAAVVVPNGPVTAEELIAHAKRHLARHKVPKEIRFADELPKNPSGKVLKRELRGTVADTSGLTG